jgi:hypothetical protein
VVGGRWWVVEVEVAEGANRCGRPFRTLRVFVFGTRPLWAALSHCLPFFGGPLIPSFRSVVVIICLSFRTPSDGLLSVIKLSTLRCAHDTRVFD